MDTNCPSSASNPSGWLCGLALGVAALIGFGCTGPSSPSQDVKRPDVVFILLDTLRADRVGAQRNGVDVAPNLSQWARSARDFQNAVSPCSWTKPTMASLFTGLYPEAHHVLYSADPNTPKVPTADVLSDEFVTLAEMLRNAGYVTEAVQTNGNMMPDFGFAQGFDTYDYVPGETAAAVTSRALALLDTPRNVPRFLYVHYIDPHMPTPHRTRPATCLGRGLT